MSEPLPLREVLTKYNLEPRKSLGQNFILDSNVTDKIARQAKNLSESLIIEIGPGPGGLTRSLLNNGARKVIAIEKDHRAVQALTDLKEYFPDKLEILEEDALEVDLNDVAGGQSFQIVANLPYNVATPLLTNWLKMIYDMPDAVNRMVLMFQKEVAQRIIAAENTKAYGRLGIMSQWLCHCSKAFDLAPSVFTPPPKVTSSVVVFNPRETLEIKPDIGDLEKITALAFHQRRKMLRSSLKDYSEILETHGINNTQRAENLTVTDFLKIAKSLK